MKWFEKTLEVLFEIFLSSPSKGIMSFLAAWVLMCWIYKLVVMGRNRDFSDVVLRPFSIRLGDSLDLPSLNKERLKVNSEHDDEELHWTVSGVYLAYWSVLAKRFMLLCVTIISIICMASLGIMYLAQPTSEVSLTNVIEFLSFYLFLPCLVSLMLISIGKAYGVVHKVPSKFNTDQNGLFVILFGW